jgi:hypothetical protein
MLMDMQDCLLHDEDIEPTVLIQALLLAIHAVEQSDIEAGRSKTKEWLCLALKALQRLLSKNGKRVANKSRGRHHHIVKRLWWCAFVTEQSYLLRRLEFAHPSDGVRPQRIALDPRGAEPLRLENFDLLQVGSGPMPPSSYWSRMQQSHCFMKKTKILCHMAALMLHKTNREQLVDSHPQSGSTLHMHHDRYFTKIQAVVSEMGQDGHGIPIGSLQETNDRSLWLSRMESQLLSARILMVFCTIGAHKFAQQGGPESNIWRHLVVSQALQAAGTTVDLAMKCTVSPVLLSREHPPPSRALFRALIASARVLSKIGDSSVVRPGLRSSTAHWLEQTIALTESFWCHPLLDHEMHLDDEDPDILTISSFAPTPQPCSAVTPRVLMINDEDQLRYLEEQRTLLDDYENLWNEDVISRLKGTDNEGGADRYVDIEMFSDARIPLD